MIALLWTPVCRSAHAMHGLCASGRHTPMQQLVCDWRECEHSATNHVEKNTDICLNFESTPFCHSTCFNLIDPELRVAPTWQISQWLTIIIFGLYRKYENNSLKRKLPVYKHTVGSDIIVLKNPAFTLLVSSSSSICVHILAHLNYLPSVCSITNRLPNTDISYKYPSLST